MKTGYIHIYCGDGKGKTTAASGLAVRASGAGLRVLIARFLKNNRSAELKPLSFLPDIDILPADREFGFIFSKNNPAIAEAKVYYTDYFERAIHKAVSEGYDLLILDEINAAVTYGIVSGDRLIDFLTSKPAELEVVLTGRDPLDRVLELADYVSEIKKIKHPFDQGVPAREGIEF